jgi:hypothetical protein
MHILAAIASNTWSCTCIITSYIHSSMVIVRYTKVLIHVNHIEVLNLQIFIRTCCAWSIDKI